MNIRCPNCQTVFRVDPARVPPSGIRARCSRCSETFFVQRDQAAATGGSTRSAPQPAARTPAASPAAAASAAATPPTGASTAGRWGAPAAAPSAATAAPPPRPTWATPPAAPATAPERTGYAAPPSAPPAAASSGFAPPRAAPTATAPASATAPAATASEPPRTTAAPRPHPFGARDPDARAMRIARALVSDIIAYHPKRWESSRDAGTLRAEFRDEIMKSWEEYVAQVGLELAKSTPHFRTALNEILARGQQIF